MTVDKALFASLLRAMASPERRLIERAKDGLLMVGEGGEKITEAQDFYAVFATEEEYRVIHAGRVLGVYPASVALAVGQTMIFAGRRWQIKAIDDDAKAMEVEPSRNARPPKFNGLWGGVHDHIVKIMRRIFCSDDEPPHLNQTAKGLLAGARSAFRRLGLATSSIAPLGNGSLIFPWVGTRKLSSLSLALNALNVEASPIGHAIELPEIRPEAAIRLLSRIAATGPPPAAVIAEKAAKPQRAKFDPFLPPDLMALVTVVEQLDVESIPGVAKCVLGSTNS